MTILPVALACPLCDNGKAELTETVQDFRVLNTTFKVLVSYYVCSSCKHEYTTTATDELTMLRLKDEIDKEFAKHKKRQP